MEGVKDVPVFDKDVFKVGRAIDVGLSTPRSRMLSKPEDYNLKFYSALIYDVEDFKIEVVYMDNDGTGPEYESLTIGDYLNGAYRIYFLERVAERVDAS